MKRDIWTLQDIQNLPSKEDDRFDRKAYSPQMELRKVLSKATSAFANSGGGHIFLGVDDDGTISGMPPILKGTQSAKDLIEQLVRVGVSPPLSSYRVHEVRLDSIGMSDKVVVVVDIDDSLEAPHQCANTCIYYQRAAANSVPASHFYLELLRHRAHAPLLNVLWRQAIAARVLELDNMLVMTGCLQTKIRNIGKSAAHGILTRWTMHESAMPSGIGMLFDPEEIPGGGQIPTPRFAKLLLPLDTITLGEPFALVLADVNPRGIESKSFFESRGWDKLNLQSRLVSKSHIGDETTVLISELLPIDGLLSTIQFLIPRPAKRPEWYHAGWGIDIANLIWKCPLGTLEHVSAFVQNTSEYDYDSVTFELEIHQLPQVGFETIACGSISNMRVGQMRSFAFRVIDEVIPNPVDVRLRVTGVHPSPLLVVSEDRDEHYLQKASHTG